MRDIYADATYLASNPTWHVEDAPFKAAGVAQMLRDNGLAQPSATIADIGCGAGQVAHGLAEALPGVSVTGFDVSPDAARLWTPGRATFRCADFLAADDTYDVVTLLDVFEHVPDYMGFLRALRPRARSFVFNIPLDMNVASMATGHLLASRRNVGHLHYFCRDTALATLEDCGYEVRMQQLRPGFRSASETRTSLRQRLIDLPRRLSYPLSPAACAFWFGGVSLLVLAWPKRGT